MEKYLKMSDCFYGEEFTSSGMVIENGLKQECFKAIASDYAKYASHAINSHDELVAMNKELLAALEDIVDSFSPIQNPRDWFRADVHVRTIDIAKSAIEKAKAAS